MTDFSVVHKGTPLRKLPVHGHTLPEIFQKQVAKYGHNRTALRSKKNARWVDYSWQDYFQHVSCVAAGLRELGLRAQDKVCILSSNCPEWVFVCVAAQCLGAFLVPIYPNNTPEQVKYIVQHSEARHLFVENTVQLSKTNHWRNQLPHLEKTTMIFGTPPADVMAYDDMAERGKIECIEHPDFLANQIDQRTPDSPGGIIYTSGTTGPPKGAILSQLNLVFEATSILTRFDTAYEEDAISFLPLSHIAEQMPMHRASKPRKMTCLRFDPHSSFPSPACMRRFTPPSWKP